MTWVGVLTALLTLANALANFLQQRQQISAATAQVVADNLRAAMDELKSAAKVRADVAARTSGSDADDRLRDDPANLYRD